MAKDIGIIGRVDDILPNNIYSVELGDGTTVLCYMAGKMRKAKITLVIGDKVDVILDPYKGKATNRIVWRR